VAPGIRSFLNEEVDFGASDAAMKDEEIAKVKRGAVLLPMTAGSIVLAFNLEGVDELKLSREAYAGIFLDKIKKWNDPKIAATNEGVELPDLEISIIRRADSSGTTYVFTKHLSAISEEWAQGPGTGKTVQVPRLGNNYGGKKNDGVRRAADADAGLDWLRRSHGFAHNSKLPMVQLENKGRQVHHGRASSRPRPRSARSRCPRT
jgi:phosphate transport system substrate-binding protein